MKTITQMVVEFHRAFGLPSPEGFTPLTKEGLALRLDLLEEEYEETVEALQARDMAGAAKELADLVYVAVGTAVQMGLPFDAILAEVHRSNMSKTWTYAEALEDERVHRLVNAGRGRWIAYNEAGKVLKGPGYSPADILDVMAEAHFGPLDETRASV